MGALVRTLRNGLAWMLTASVISCGGGDGASSAGSAPGGGTPVPAGNVVAVVVDSGPTANMPGVNTLYTTVTVCAHGSTSQCQTIDHIQVDTGSYGLRILSSVLTIALPVASASDGNSLVECTQFADGYSWGPVSLADMTVAGEVANSLPIQIIGSANFASVPDTCSSTGMQEDTVAQFGANGILGIGVFAQDCGAGCATNTPSGYYYSCSATACLPIDVPVTSQVLNPIVLFAADNNGSFIELPAVAAAGATTVTGSLIFGIDTESNNASGNQTILTLNPDDGYFTTTYAGTALARSFIDSGSNGIFFNDSGIAECTDTNFSDFYCPAITDNLSATLTAYGTSGISVTESFSVGNAQTLVTNNPTFTVLPTLAGTYPGATDQFDWGLPFFYGRKIANAIEGQATAVGTGPYAAF